MAEEMTPEARRAFRVAPRIAERYDGPDGVEDFVRFAHEALGMIVRVKPTKILALDRVGEHTDERDVN